MNNHDLIQKIWNDKSPGTAGFRRLLLSIWRVDEVDWQAVKVELGRIPEGRAVVTEIEKLPYFKEIVRGNYDSVIRALPKDEQQRVFDAWEKIEAEKLRPLEPFWLEVKRQEYED